jgi:DNA processing protein
MLVSELTDGDKAALLLNMVPGVGARTFGRLVSHFGDAASVLGSRNEVLQTVPGVGPALAKAILDAPWQVELEQELADCLAHGVQLLMLTRPDYPAALRTIPDPPPVLYCQGEILEADRLAIAMVGSRHITDYGAKVAARFGRGLAMAGFCVVSGMARGVDAACHRAVLAAGGRTLAVLGSGLLNCYPPEHAGLAGEIAAQGAVISELPLHRPPHAGAFPQRNRIVSGLSLGVVVVEAGSRSGALITARLAAEQNRDVFAIPGRIDSRGSLGCHDLIRDGAILVQSVDDILEALGPLAEPVQLQSQAPVQAGVDAGVPSSSHASGSFRSHDKIKGGVLAASAAQVPQPKHRTHARDAADQTKLDGGTAGSDKQNASQSRTIHAPAELLLNPQEVQVLQVIDVEPMLIDEVVSRTSLPVSRVLSTLTVLQSRRLIRRIGGNQVARV